MRNHQYWRITMTNFTVGADPELFLRKNGRPVSAHGLFEGTKENPQPVPGGAIQVDGMACEFNIDPVPYKGGWKAFDANITSAIGSLRKQVEGHSLSIRPTQDFDAKYIKEQPPEAKELGCDPDFNAYTMVENPTPDGSVNFRTAAGHVHVGWGADIPVDSEEHLEICASLVKHLDQCVGLYMTCIDDDPRRRELYGKAGAFRPKPYGVEYRTPSNVWLKNKTRRKLMYSLIRISIGRRMNNSPLYQTVPSIINTGDSRGAINCLEQILSHRLIQQIRGEMTNAK